MKKEMIINVLQPEECRIAIVENGILEELYVERASHENYVSNIYKGKVVNIEPSIQAAFIDFGVGRNGFLHISDVEPTYYQHLEGFSQENDDSRGGGGRRRGGSRRSKRSNSPHDEVDYLDTDERTSTEAEANSTNQSEDDLAEFRFPQSNGESTDTLAEDEAPVELVEDDSKNDEESPLSFAPDAAESGKLSTSTPETGEGEPALSPTVDGPPVAEAIPVVTSEMDASSEAESPTPERTAPEEERSREAGEGEPRLETSEDNDDDLSFPRAQPMTAVEHRTESTIEVETQDAPSAEPTEEELVEESVEEEVEEEVVEVEDESPAESDTGEDTQEKNKDQVEASTETVNEEEDDLLFFPRPAQTQVEEVETEEETEEEEIVEVEEEQAEEEVEEWSELPEIDRSVPIEKELEQDLRDADIEVPEGLGRTSSPRGRKRSGGGGGSGGRGNRGGGSRDNRGGGGRGRGRNDRSGSRRGSHQRSGGGRPGSGRPKPLIQDVFKRGQEVLVQVIKEGLGPKGPTLSTYISIAGRYLVLMPGLNRVGVSRKIIDEDKRRRLRDIFTELQPPKGLGFIIRTAGEDRSKQELSRDLSYLTRLWQVVVRRIKKTRSPAEIYQESDMITRTIRDTFSNDIDTIWIDEPKAFERAQEFLQIVMPKYADRIKLYEGQEPLFHKYRIEEEIEKIQKRKVDLDNGGSIVIDQTEALVAIDVNSGNYRSESNSAEETAYQMNLAAAKEIARQLRLRDLGGVIVNDFIDMRDEKHRRSVERVLRDAVKRDRARTKVLRMSQFGLVEMTRQRIRPSLKRSTDEECTHCGGLGHNKTAESMSIEVMRLLRHAFHRDHISRIDVTVTEAVAWYLLNRKRRIIAELEEEGGVQINILSDAKAPPAKLELTCFDNNDNEVELHPKMPAPRGNRRRN